MEEFSDSPPSRRATRNLPLRAAKIKIPVRTTRSSTQAATYLSSHSLTSSPASDANFDDSDSDRPIKPLRRSTRKRQKPQPSNLPPTKRTRHHHIAKRLRPSTPSPEPLAAEECQLLKVFPPWKSLPYHVWLRVFEHIAEPIRDNASRRDDIAEAIGSLHSSALTCRATAEPALASLYKCPPFYPSTFTKSPQASFAQFIDLLRLPPTATTIRYRPKIEILRIDVGTFLTRKFNGGYLNLRDLARNLPRLTHLELYHDLDEPPYRDLDSHIRWRIAEEDLLQALQPIPDANVALGDKDDATRLKSWRWNPRLVPEDWSLARLTQIHLNPSFASLRKVAYVNYQLPSLQLPSRLRDDERLRELEELDRTRISDLAASISALPDLEHLILESSTLANGALLKQLPKSLKYLELINCGEIVASELADFLLTHGSSIEGLTLNHCQGLSLAFLPTLGFSCPNLTHLHMDLNYYRHHTHYADNKPEYDTLLAEDQMPSWPSSIQSIEIIHMRNWSREAANLFFQSLVDSAPHLPHLRYLVLKVILDIEWRARQEMRTSWVDTMKRVFQRKSNAPKKLTTLRLPKPAPKTEPPRTLTNTGRPMRRSMRIAELVPVSPDSDVAPVKPLGTLKKRVPIHDADDEDSEDELLADHFREYASINKGTKAKKLRHGDIAFRHGLCDLVEVSVDNQRPRERQFDMEDFLDSPEDSSDGDWDGGDVDVFV
ncbi:hypothetical protein F4778DRAFT_719339 [Xylariomycetidae sp. FL2044]|nr:hypothetical protein F4778DRAFT_719339 [Xylariomycetidae sp. FL2044]